ncbi:hypothetical protein CKK33_16695 [Mucilaginibacter sp. MD40]|uniref:SIR2 family protein n=1 Tax=Mucilaginibacter sp. MD40 TaxID=2029590 RepID=UPI000BAC5C0F|nr:SIR2 family protein [Mucilaginibacter sp. MD40]PAW95045.1 hypothetical protein CKK33_16695 [Mucilaginibacter sp. MD40]
MRINPHTKPKKKVAIFLGAGASAADGAPIQSNIFRDYFNSLKRRKPSKEHEHELVAFFKKMFDIDVLYKNLDNINFPTFEEALGILDLADLKNEAFKELSNINLEVNSGRIKFLRLYLLFLMADIINEKLQKPDTLHRVLVNNLSKDQLDQTTFLTTNYDILCDNALYYLNRFETNYKKVDYGVEFIDYRNGTFERPNDNSIKLLKLHGSLNWLHCPVCNNLHITPNEKGVYRMMTNLDSMRCENCQGVYSPIIIPPTFYKDMSKVYLGQVWNVAEAELLNTNHLIFCGYSFPDADIHIKYLIKRIQKNRNPKNELKVTIINNHDDKEQSIKDEEKNRYQRFLGKNINYTDLSFKDFANNPLQII